MYKKTTKICPYCHKEFTTRRKNVCCSHSCGVKHRDFPNKKYNGGYRDFICLNCKKPFKIYISDYKRVGKFCCHKCWKEYNRIKKTRVCHFCGKTYISRELGRNVKFCSIKCYNRYARLDKHPLWRGGISFGKYSFTFSKYLKEKIRERDNFTCQLCGVDQKECAGKLCIHHIDYNKCNTNINNLVTLCRSCHSKTNYYREKWIKHFKNNLQVRF